jgi:hypothetical protein
VLTLELAGMAKLVSVVAQTLVRRGREAKRLRELGNRRGPGGTETTPT